MMVVMRAVFFFSVRGVVCLGDMLKMHYTV